MNGTLAPIWPSRIGPSDPERNVRLHVHVALAAIVLAPLAPIVAWVLFASDVRAPAGTWKRRLLAIAIIDTLLVLGTAAAQTFGVDFGSVAEPPHIGVALDPEASPPGVRIERVAPGSPADHASLRDGDRIVAVDGRPVDDVAHLSESIEQTPRGVARRLTILRDGRTFDASVTPELGAPVPEQRSESLFAGRSTPRTAPSQGQHRVVLGAGAVGGIIVLGLLLAAARRGFTPVPGFVVIAALVALAAASSAVLVAFERTLGLSLGALLVSMLAGSAALLLIGAAGRALVHAPPVRIGPEIGTGKAIALGVLYGASGAARLTMVVALAAAIFHAPLRGAARAFGLSIAWGPLGVGLFLVATVLIAPVAEELVFRGVLLPWLARWMRPWPAIVWSAAVFGLGHLYYGLGAVLVGFYGIVLGWARLRTGKLWASIVLHALLNATTAAALLAGSTS